MDFFAYSSKVESLRAELMRFFNESVYPNETLYWQEVERNRSAGNAWQPTQIVEQLKSRARALGL